MFRGDHRSGLLRRHLPRPHHDTAARPDCALGNPAAFNVSAIGENPCTITVSEFSAISDATNNTLQHCRHDPERCGIIWSSSPTPLGARRSSVATLTVIAAPLILTNPASLTVSTGSPAGFSVHRPHRSYQWRFNGGDIPTATNSSYAGLNAQPTDAGNYSVVITNDYGSITSAPAALTVVSGTARMW